MLRKIGYAFGYILGVIDAIRCYRRFKKWSKEWAKEHPTVTKEIFAEYSDRWWQRRYSEIL